MGGQEQLDEALVALRRYSLISNSTQASQIKIHRLVQVVTQEALSQGYFGEDPKTQTPYRPKAILSTLKTSVASYYPEDKRTEADYTLTRHLLAHLETLIEHYEPRSSSTSTRSGSIKHPTSDPQGASAESTAESRKTIELVTRRNLCDKIQKIIIR